MTDIDTLEGPELDALVAERIMGWRRGTRCRYDWQAMGTEGHEEPNWRNGKGEHECYFFVPSSCNGDDLMEAFLKALDDGRAVEMWKKDGTYSAFVDSPLGLDGICTAPTLPLALCRALVTAYMAEKPARPRSPVPRGAPALDTFESMMEGMGAKFVDVTPTKRRQKVVK